MQCVVAPSWGFQMWAWCGVGVVPDVSNNTVTHTFPVSGLS